MTVAQNFYIPVGTIVIPRAETNLSLNQLEIQELRSWSFLDPHWRENRQHPQNGSEPAGISLGYEIHLALLQSPALTLISRLLQAQWVNVEVCVANEVNLIARVYVLPDDVLRSSLNRSNQSLMKSRTKTLRSLDYSEEAWEGNVKSPHVCQKEPKSVNVLENEESERETSLLELFNSIPSPNPDPESVSGLSEQDAMCDLLASTVDGLKTELYPYQRRSAAFMLQKEVHPGQFLDPRLVHVKGQMQSTWYHDSVSGSVLQEPRYYDGVSGGILAEEMGSGKTIICLSLILATKNLPCPPPSVHGIAEPPHRPRLGSLMDMAASSVSRHAVTWKPYLHSYNSEGDFSLSRCCEAIQRNPGHYFIPPNQPLRHLRRASYTRPPQKIFLSSATIIVVPNNLLAQWNHEIRKHTESLRVLVVIKEDDLPALSVLLEFDILLFSQSRFEAISLWEDKTRNSSLRQVHFKRCIIDEGHKLGNSRISHRSNLLLGLDALHVTSRWIVTGTPAQGLFGVDKNLETGIHSSNENSDKESLEPLSEGKSTDSKLNQKAAAMEKKDLERIGAITSLYLQARPWANTTMDTEDTKADWNVYLMLPRHQQKSQGRWECLKSTLNSLILRHQLAEVRELLPPVNEKVVVLDGSHQDLLSLNIFRMMIVFNAVQSQRTDQDYFFHPKQRRALLQIVANMKQASVFGGSFFSHKELTKAVETAEQFLLEGKVTISQEDDTLLKEAIQFGHVATSNSLRKLTHEFHEMPCLVKEFPGSAGEAWSLDGSPGAEVCTSASLLQALQKLIYNAASRPEVLNALLNGGLVSEGKAVREKLLVANNSENPTASANGNQAPLAGNTRLGDGTAKKSRSHGVNGLKPKDSFQEASLSRQLQSTQITSTVSAKMSYLIDGLMKYSENEKIIVFYENENIAFYLASMLDVLQLQYLIYAKSLTTTRRAQYVNTFHNNNEFRILLMDLTQAAFGLDMKGASRIYFISPVLNPQVEAQAIGRVRRISQQKPVSVETLVLRGSIDEVLLERKQHMTQAEQRQAKSVLDIQPVYNWIKQASMVPMSEVGQDAESQMAPLRVPLPVFGRGFGRAFHPDEGIMLDEPDHNNTHKLLEPSREQAKPEKKEKRAHSSNEVAEPDALQTGPPSDTGATSHLPKRIKFAI